MQHINLSFGEQKEFETNDPAIMTLKIKSKGVIVDETYGPASNAVKDGKDRGGCTSLDIGAYSHTLVKC